MMDVFLFTLAAIALLVAIVALIRWKVRRDWARIERRMAERDHATLQSYKKHTIPGRRSSPDTIPSSSSRCSTQGDTAAPTSWDIPAMSAIHRSAEPSGLEPTIIGGGGSFGGGGASQKAAPKSRQGGYLNLDFSAMFAALVIVGVLIGIALTLGVPWLWDKAKPFIHAVTA